MQRITRSLLSALLLSAPLFSQSTSTILQQIVQGDVQYDEKRDPSSDDMEALRRWIRDKRLVTVKEIGGDLSISGEVRTEFQDNSEVKAGIQQRGKGGALDKPQYAWDSEVNIMIDYRTDRTWAAIKFEFDNDMGSRTGTIKNIRLEKGYLGGRIVPGDTLTIDGEIGRRFLFNVFDSKVEFASMYDGVLFRFNKAWPSIGDYYVNVGALVVDDKTSHYAYVMEMGGLRIANIGLNLKYSLIDWYKPCANELRKWRYKYLTSQLLAVYQFYPDWLGKRLIKFYGAGLSNHLASGKPLTHGKKQNWAWYTGVSIGLVKKQFDWAIDLNYQWVQAQAIAEFDVTGIGRGNGAGVGLYTNNINGDTSSGATLPSTAVGSTNYKGFEVEALYAITDNRTVMQKFKLSTTLDKKIGPEIVYKQYECEFIYAF